MKKFIILLLVGLTLFSCDNEGGSNDTDPIFYFSLLDANGNPLIHSEDQKIEMWCYKDGEKAEIFDILIFKTDSYYKYEFGSHLIPLHAGDSDINDFYINQGDGDVDTLYFTVTSDINYYAKEVKYNGKDVVRDTTNHWPYILQK